jgi:flagellin
MSMVIGTNVASITAQRHLETSRADMETSMERLASGKRINSAMDDAAGLAIAGRMSAQVEGLSMAVKNANDGVSMLQTAEGGLEETTDILLRMRELAVQSSSDTYNATDRAALDNEFDALKAEITRISDRTDFNGTSVLNSTATVDIQVGADTGDTISFTFKDIDAANIGGTPGETAAAATTAAITYTQTLSTTVGAGQEATYEINGNTYTQEYVPGAGSAADQSKATLDALGVKISAGESNISGAVSNGAGTVLTFTQAVTDINNLGVAKMEDPLTSDDISTKAGAVNAIDSIDSALLEVATYRGELGATSNRLTHTVDNLMNRIENTSSARSQIEDTDFASESASLAKSQVLQQAGTAMLAQANASGQSVMSLLK